MRTAVIILAAGMGTRMGADLPKQFLKIDGRTILVRTLERFAEALPESEILVVLSEGMLPLWQEILVQENCKVAHKVCYGGSERFFSVQNALSQVEDADLVAVHDGVRPFLSCEMILRGVETAQKYSSAVPVIEAVDSFREVSAEGSKALVRSTLRAVQTPQIFDFQLLRNAYAKGFSPDFTDDASVVEAFGGKIALYQGERENIKITSPLDLIFGEVLIKKS